MVLTSGSHTPIAEAAAEAGRHVLVEKPMCFSAAEGRAMVAAAERAGVVLMTGYPKRYDPAFAPDAGGDGRRGRRAAGAGDHVRVAAAALHPALPAAAPRCRCRPRRRLSLRADSSTSGSAAAAGTASDLERRVYEGVLLDTLVHELNTVRGLLGEPTRLEYASLAMDQVTVMLRFGDLPVAIHWIDLPGIAGTGWSSRCTRRIGGCA